MTLPPGVVGTDPTVDLDAKVKCGTCTACCRKELVLLMPEDDRTLYPEAVALQMFHPFTNEFPTWHIPVKKDGACVYLGPTGCTIYDKRPKMCRVFSCVGFVKKVLAAVPRAQRRADLKSGALDREIWDAGMTRMDDAP